MARRRCFRHLDSPFVVLFGLGPADLFGVGAVTAVLMIVLNPFLGLIGGLLAGVAVRRLKDGRSRGYAFGLFYRWGLVALVPPALLPPGLVLPPTAGGDPASRSLRYSPVAGEVDGTSREARFFGGWQGRRKGGSREGTA